MTMPTAPELSADEQATVDRFEAAEEPEEIRVIRAVLEVIDDLDRFSDDENFEWRARGDLQRLGARDAYDCAVSRLNTALRDLDPS